MANPVSYEELLAFVKGIADSSYTDARMSYANTVDDARALMRRGPSSKPDAATMRTLRAAVASATSDRPSIGEFLSRVSALHPALAAAAEGVYTGREARITAPIADWGVMLCFGWYSNEVRKYVVEWSYIS